MKCCFTSAETVGLLETGARDGHLDFHTAPELWKWGLVAVDSLWTEEVGEEGGILYTYRYTVTTRMTPALRWAGDESHVNVLSIVRDKVTRRCPETTTFLKRKEKPKRNRTEVLLLTSLMPCRLAKPVHKEEGRTRRTGGTGSSLALAARPSCTSKMPCSLSDLSLSHHIPIAR